MRLEKRFKMLTLAVLCAVSSLIRADEPSGQHWAFLPPERPPIPAVSNPDWVRTPVDSFILARLEESGLEPSPPASLRVLARRLFFDLTGLPPSPEELQQFLSDGSPDAETRLVDRLLSSPLHGERWAQHWLDVVRYADSDGFEYDDPRPHAWRYRDWVVRAFNEDLAYDRFVAAQVAGDEISPGDIDSLVATGLHRLGPLRLNKGNQNLEKNRQEVLTEMTDMIGTAMLGLTLGCARCHEHKFDPIPQADYFRLQAFFAATQPRDIPLATAAEKKAYEKRAEEWKRRVAEIEEKLAAVNSGAETGDARERLEHALRELKREEPRPLPIVMAVAEEGDEVPPTYVLFRGEPGAHRDRVGPSFPGILTVAEDKRFLEQLDGSSGRRAALARWLVSRGNALVARVIVNRLWQHHFGRGLVSTPNDFGHNGSRPTHPRLLDWLASEFVARGWSIKEMHRLLVNSATYRQTSQNGRTHVPATAVDPENRLWWRMEKRRLDAEALRDSVLCVSGELNLKAGGPGVYPRLGAEIADQQYKGEYQATAEAAEHSRRSLYLFVKRNIRLPLFEVFDAPDTLTSCPRRTTSTHAGQALALLNSPFLNEQAVSLAANVRATHPTRNGPWPTLALVDRAYRLTLGRSPSAAESARACSFIQEQKERIAAETGDAEAALDAALTDFCLVLFNLDEFIFVD